MINRKLTILYWSVQALVLLAFFLYDKANVQLNLITEFNQGGNLSLWRAIYRLSFSLWAIGWSTLIIGSFLGSSRGCYVSDHSKKKHIALAFFFPPLIVLIAVMIFQPL